MHPGTSNPAASQVGYLLRELTGSKNLTSAPAAEAIASLKRRFAVNPRGGGYLATPSSQPPGPIRSPGA